MNWIATLILATIVAVFFIVKKSGQISSKDALAYVKNGVSAAHWGLIFAVFQPPRAPTSPTAPKMLRRGIGVNPWS